MLLRKNIIKYSNLLLSTSSYLYSVTGGRSSVVGMPLALGIELTNVCNLLCSECFSGSGQMTRNKGYMAPLLFEKLIGELGPYLFYLNLYFQGEPMLHPQFFSFIEKARGIRSVVSTNGHFLTEDNAVKLVQSGIYKVIISLDGLDRETYSTYRKGGNVERVTESIKNVSRAKREYDSALKLEIQVLVNRYNEHQIPAIARFAQDMNATLRLKSMQIINKSMFAVWLPEDEKYRRYEKRDNRYVRKNSASGGCGRLWFNPVITWDGKVLPCCFDKDASHILGDLNNESFRSIWFGEKNKLFRKRVLSQRKAIEICRNCTTGLKGIKF
jgi:radical SAM protein with 4Fe4S-binding SPASM domain